ncbi:DUF4286 family protein [uncultured Polaribacter sp.]|uniref:DUF4286 family protein n=1 Tax=uncultured Polaribacter sp. TaxID=174711 RepID=UPI002625C6BB|nr:DUF4286 family protein [uncultured Polaribacter sp.]
MYIYNVTVNIDDAVHEEWLNWINSKINQVLDTGKFTSAKLTEVLVTEEMGGKTYSVQYTTQSKEILDAYYKENASLMQAEGIQKFGANMLTFRTELRVVQEFFPKSTSN